MRYSFWCWDSVVSPLEIKKINKFIRENSNPSLKDQVNPALNKKASVSIIEWPKLRKKLAGMEDVINQTNHLYFNFKTYRFNTFDAMNHNVYDSTKGGEYEYHIDVESYKLDFTTKLTCVLNLSEDPYEGGEFYIKDGPEIHIKKMSVPGALVVFPSFLLHKVTPVTKGKRTSLVLWKKGPWWT